MRILLVEDDRPLAESLKYQLEDEGLTVDTCHNGEDGLYYALSVPYDLLLLDRMLPGSDGVALLQELRRRGSGVPVILLTALGDLSDKIEGLDAGADDYIVKPFAIEEIMARIRSVTGGPGDGATRRTCGLATCPCPRKRACLPAPAAIAASQSGRPS